MTSNNNDMRNEFLLHMYDQMFNDINRHVLMVWQPITLVIGSVSLLAAGAKNILSIDLAIALAILLVGWLIANLYDSAYWYNRNLVIIANIERQFLRQTDLKDIHYYFGKHRSKHSMLTHIRIQWWLGMCVGGLLLLYHIFTEVLKIFPFILDPPVDFRWQLTLPYGAAVAMLILTAWVRKHRIQSYDEFIRNSPGIVVDTSGLDYGVGHPIDQVTDTGESGGQKSKN